MMLVGFMFSNFARKYHKAGNCNSNYIGKDSPFIGVRLRPKFRIWPINSEAMSTRPFFAKTRRTFNSWKIPAKGVKTDR
jgi:hypothetical protein